ncbi:MAG TPA: NAD(P)(+) transhydrogenase (Re/Si-specific) subunit beta [bacterium]|nr:NAD(P)(+) transhydrogenase (Re/Si-specific) subunit beta [bacterium]
MNNAANIAVDIAIILVLIAGISRFRTPAGARFGNAMAALALLFAVAVALYRNPILSSNAALAALALAASSLAAWRVSANINMTRIPSLVAFQNGAGGLAALLVAIVEMSGAGPAPGAVASAAAAVSVSLGAATFSGSMIASLKLAGKIRQTPTVIPGHNIALLVLSAACAAAAALMFAPGDPTSALVSLAFLSLAFGALFSIRIGGADMPVLISFLNAATGMAAAFCGIVIQNRLLIACGAVVASSGFILTMVMCRAMNRSLMNIIAGGKAPARAHASSSATVSSPETTAEPSAPVDVSQPEQPEADPHSRAADALRDAKKLIVIPGYGMAIAQAQSETVALAGMLEQAGTEVKYAVHPVAGRMPGHMHVLLAEADVDYDKLFEMDDINAEFAETDVALIVGACDVVNPAAKEKEGTPISGMPVLNAGDARSVIVCNFDDKPGYSGVPNPIYERPNAILLFGDAKATLASLIAELK